MNEITKEITSFEELDTYITIEKQNTRDASLCSTIQIAHENPQYREDIDYTKPWVDVLLVTKWINDRFPNKSGEWDWHSFKQPTITIFMEVRK